MSLNKQLQCKTSYQDYLVFQSRQLLAQLTPESLARLNIQIQARLQLSNRPVVNSKIYLSVMEKVKGELSAEKIS